MFELIIVLILVIAIPTVLVTLFRSGKSKDAHTLRFIAVAIGSMALAILASTAVATKWLLYGLAASSMLTEAFYLSGFHKRFKALAGTVDLLPIFIPIFAIMPYWSMITYFFGYDNAILIFSLIVVISYIVLSRSPGEKSQLTVNSIIALSSMTMLIWFAVVTIDAGV